MLNSKIQCLQWLNTLHGLKLCCLFMCKNFLLGPNSFFFRFRTIAYLKQIWWVEVDGDIEFWFPTGTYTLSFKLRLGKLIKRNGRLVCSTEDVHGWGVKPVEFKLTTGTGEHSIAKKFLKTTGNWGYHRVGDFTVNDSNTPTKVKFSLTQIDCTHTKGGLCIDSVLICPSHQVAQ